MIGKKGICAIFAAGLVTLLPLNSFADTDIQTARDISEIEVDGHKLEQAIASRTLTWLTGSSSNNDYVSVGRLANFFGFVALRVSSHHSLSRSAVAKETLLVLNKRQQSALILLVEDQKESFEAVKLARFEMNRALEGLLVGETISEEAFLELGERYGAAEAELGRVIGQRLGVVAASLSSKQTDKFSDIRNKYASGKASDRKIKGVKTNLSKPDKKELINLAARLLSWTTGDPDLNDFEVVGKPSQHFGFVSLRIESNHGVKRGAVANEVLGLLSPEHKADIRVSADRNIELFEEFMSHRKQLMRTLEVALKGEVIDPKRVTEIGKHMGRKEAEMTWSQAMAMLDIRDTMSEQQAAGLLDLRQKYTGQSAAIPQDLLTRGRQLYAQCALCHSDTQSALAPNLTDLVDREVANDTAYANYSSALKNFALKQPIWDDATLDAFLKTPKDAVPGTYMGYSGLGGKTDREALILYLKERE